MCAAKPRSEVIGVIVLARNGDRTEYYQDPKTYRGTFTQTTALGEVNFAYSFQNVNVSY